MRFRLLATVVLMVVAGGMAQRVSAQSLAAVARQEEERRRNVKDPAKVLTNKDLGSVPSPPEAPSVSEAPAGTAASGAKAGEAGKEVPKDPNKDKSQDSKDPLKDQKYWSDRLKLLQTQLDRDQNYSGALQTQINSLTADFVNRDDPAQKAQIEQNRQKALVELNRLTEAIGKDKKAIDDFNDEARRAGVPPGWLR
jgi:hypothetical protein